MKTHRTTLIMILSMGTTACGLEKLPDDGGGGGGIPRIVQDQFDASCAIVGCHAGTYEPNLTAGSSAAIVGGASTASIPYVTFGDLSQSYLAHKILGDDPRYPMITGTVMPPPGVAPLPESGLAIILGWIAVGNDAFEVPGGSGSDTGDTGTGEDTVGAEETTTTTTTTTGSPDTGDPTDTSDSVDPSVSGPLSHARDIQPIWTATCASATCHGGLFAPNLSDGVAYDSIVNEESPVTGIALIAPADVEGSYLWQKITGATGIAGSKMPVTGVISDADIATIEQWIDEGAQP